jgi:hypothetical protein
LLERCFLTGWVKLLPLVVAGVLDLPYVLRGRGMPYVVPLAFLLLRRCRCWVVSSLTVSAHGREALSSPRALPFRPAVSIALSFAFPGPKSEACSEKTGTGKVADGLLPSKAEPPPLKRLREMFTPADGTHFSKNMVQVCDLDLPWPEVCNFRETRNFLINALPLLGLPAFVFGFGPTPGPYSASFSVCV